jgi:hypothetical protein
MTQPVIEPNFEGEEMKIPEGVVETETLAMPAKSALSTTMIVLLTVALIAIFAGLGYWYTLVMNAPMGGGFGEGSDIMMEPEIPKQMGDAELSNSDEIDAIEADINNTELEQLDQELNQIDAELEAELGAQ